MLDYEKKYQGKIIAGIDEAGRGPLAGPVVCACVIMPLEEDKIIEGINDSKKLTEKKREELELLIKERAIAYSIIEIDEKTIDEINILNATKLGMKKALENIKMVGVEDKIRVMEGDALDILPYLNEKYDVIFIDASKGKYLEFFEHALRLSPVGGWIIADNVLYKGMVLSDYNKHKQRTAVNKLRSFIDVVMETECLNSELVDIGDGLTISKKIKEWEK